MSQSGHNADPKHLPGKLAMLPDLSSSGMESIVLGHVEFPLVLFRIDELLFIVELPLLISSVVVA